MYEMFIILLLYSRPYSLFTPTPPESSHPHISFSISRYLLYYTPRCSVSAAPMRMIVESWSTGQWPSLWIKWSFPPLAAINSQQLFCSGWVGGSGTPLPYLNVDWLELVWKQWTSCVQKAFVILFERVSDFVPQGRLKLSLWPGLVPASNLSSSNSQMQGLRA